MQQKQFTTIGRAERIVIKDHGTQLVPAKVDTGADVSSLWASSIHEEAGVLSFELFGEGSDYYTGEVVTLRHTDYTLTRVANSFGMAERRYVVRMSIIIHGRTIKTSFTLANRSAKVYPVLLGRRMLTGKFLVDVSQGQSLSREERKLLRAQRTQLKEQNEHKESA